MTEVFQVDPMKFSRAKEWVDYLGSWDLRQYSENNVAVADVAVVSEFLWPSFVEVEGCVFVEFLFFEDSYREWSGKFDGDRPRIEPKTSIRWRPRSP